MTQAHHHHTKFRWTENLTCRFIQLRKENGKLFTGRKYSAQAGWELILQQMRQEFPSIMTDVHYRVLKKKWSNLLQQYKELKNPVHGDKNRADDVSWPFYGAIDEVLECSGGGGGGRRTPGSSSSSYVDYIDPHEFLCVSVTPDDEVGDATTTLEEFPTDEREDEKNDEHEVTFSRGSTTPKRGRQNSKEDSVGSTPAIELERILRGDQTINRAPRSHLAARRKRNSRNLSSGMPRLPGGTEISIEKITTRSIFGKDPPAKSRIRNDLVVCSSSTSAEAPATTTCKRNENQSNLTNVTTTSTTWTTSVSASANAKRNEVGTGQEERPKKSRRTRGPSSTSWCQEDHEARIDRRLEQFFQYARRRDEENRSIMMRILCAVETIANKL